MSRKTLFLLTAIVLNIHSYSAMAESTLNLRIISLLPKTVQVGTYGNNIIQAGPAVHGNGASVQWKVTPSNPLMYIGYIYIGGSFISSCHYSTGELVVLNAADYQNDLVTITFTKATGDNGMKDLECTCEGSICDTTLLKKSI